MSLTNEEKERNYKIKGVLSFANIILLVATIILCICSLLFKWSPLFPIATYGISYLIRIINNKLLIKDEPKKKKNKKDSN